MRITPTHALPVEIYRGVASQLIYDVVNEGTDPITISSVFPRKGEGSGRADPQTLAPGGKGRIILEYKFPEALGRDQVNFLVKAGAEKSNVGVIRIPYFVQAAYGPEFAVLDFGTMLPGQKLQTKLDFDTRLVNELKFTKVVSKPDWLDISFVSPESGSSQAVGVVATTNKLPEFGLNVGEVILESNVEEDSQLRIPVIVRAFSKYTVSPIPVSLGGVPEGQDSKVNLRVNRVGGGGVRIKKINSGSSALKIETSDCGNGCVDLDVMFDSMRARRGLRAVINVQFEDDEVDLQIPIDALVVPIGVKVTDLGDLDEVTVRSTTTILGEQ
ncbi:hypothetical protein [Dokdonella sp.]|uniref:hypothetical protein n=1 Tax=Dokdonella sp. TaxID=2291710 RepID=UPI003C6EAFDE